MRNRIAELRKAHRLTQQDLADRVEVTRQTLISLENGRYNPSIALAFKLSRTFGQTIEEIFVYEEDES